jgi:phosphatidylserine/phosphatidylglycerophosphate/cardiolipin synthase-like enzyme
LKQARDLLCGAGLPPAEAEDAIFSLLNLEVLRVTIPSADFESSPVELGPSADMLETALDDLFAQKQRATRPQQQERQADLAPGEVLAFEGLCATLPLYIDGTISGRQFYSIRHAVSGLIEQAQHSLEIASPYLNAQGMASLEDALRKAASAGVRLKVLTRIENLSEPDPALAQGLFYLLRIFGSNFEAANLAYTIKHPARKYAKVTSALHAKMVVSDRQAAYIGSADLRHTALHSNFEIGMILRESKQVEAVADLFDTAWDVSVSIDPDYIKQRAGL